MTLEEYRRALGWSISELARRAGVDFNTAKKALSGGQISVKSAGSIANALSEAMGKRIFVTDIAGLNVAY
jgi:transcriptional regulator with XRE-family HTH domain